MAPWNLTKAYCLVEYSHKEGHWRLIMKTSTPCLKPPSGVVLLQKWLRRVFSSHSRPIWCQNILQKFCRRKTSLQLRSWWIWPYPKIHGAAPENDLTPYELLLDFKENATVHDFAFHRTLFATFQYGSGSLDTRYTTNKPNNRHEKTNAQRTPRILARVVHVNVSPTITSATKLSSTASLLEMELQLTLLNSSEPRVFSPMNHTNNNHFLPLS